MPIVWPVELPTAPLEQGYSEGIPNNTLRSSVDAGPAKVRRKGGLVPFPITVTMLCTAEQIATLETFISGTLQEGALRFEWTHPRTGATVETRFLPSGERLVSIEPSGPFRWLASFSLEVLP